MSKLLPPRTWVYAYNERTKNDRWAVTWTSFESTHFAQNYHKVEIDESHALHSYNDIDVAMVTQTEIPKSDWVRIRNVFYFFTLEQAIVFKLKYGDMK